jgi:RNA polymerase sigma-70 factor (ECF subfamily)
MEVDRRARLSRELARLADGDRDAFDAVFAGLWPEVRAFVGRVLPPADADDVAQGALLRVFARASDYERDRDALAWAVGIAAWEVRTHRRRRQRRRETGLHAAPETAAAGLTPEDAVIDADLRRALLDVVGTLPELDREALGLDSPGVQPASATQRKRRQRAIGRLRHAWSRIHGPR